jgi:hypothetical protein
MSKRTLNRTTQQNISNLFEDNENGTDLSDVEYDDDVYMDAEFNESIFEDNC